MGKVKASLVKRIGKELWKSKRELFTAKFEHNKRVLAQLNMTRRFRNQIAGYITRLAKSS